jgi:hypothetical protein
MPLNITTPHKFCIDDTTTHKFYIHHQVHNTSSQHPIEHVNSHGDPAPHPSPAAAPHPSHCYPHDSLKRLNRIHMHNSSNTSGASGVPGGSHHRESICAAWSDASGCWLRRRCEEERQGLHRRGGPVRRGLQPPARG